ALGSDTEDLVNLSLTIQGTQAAVILVEQKPDVYKVSFRSRCEMDCSEVAAEFNGGGHQAAAGGSVEGGFEDARRRVLDAVGSRLA
ncbi:MAG: DHHA1 domain-containing protein, partial [Pirellulaceae bacterium]|nr:DHHA1 domain-containing protein [Pirellulaceae bacterium]